MSRGWGGGECAVRGEGITPLLIAVWESQWQQQRRHSNPEIVALLLEAGAVPNARNKYGSTPLHFAAWDSNPAVIAALLDGGADVGARSPFYSTPLHWAAGANEDPDVIAVLLAAGADPNARDKFGDTPLYVAAKYNTNPEVIILLFEAGARVKAHRWGGIAWARIKDREELKGTETYERLREATLGEDQDP